MLEKIITGGQTGADRAALDAVMESRFPIGGNCPAGRMAEDGIINHLYPLDEIEGGYESRTQKNVADSDGTAIFYEENLFGGTEQTLDFCLELKKPHILIDIDLLDMDEAANRVSSFITDYRIRVLNVAGPRLSHCPSIYNYVKDALKGVINKSI